MSSYPNITQQAQSAAFTTNGMPHQTQQQQQQQQRMQQQQPSLNKYLPPNVPSVQPVYSSSQSMQKPIYNQSVLLTNGGSSHSSRTASPSFNYSQNAMITSASSYSTRTPPINCMPPAAASPQLQNPNLPPSASSASLNRNIGGLVNNSHQNVAAGSPVINRSMQNLANVTNSMQSLSMSQTNLNRPPPPSTESLNDSQSQQRSGNSNMGSMKTVNSSFQPSIQPGTYTTPVSSYTSSPSIQQQQQPHQQQQPNQFVMHSPSPILQNAVRPPVNTVPQTNQMSSTFPVVSNQYGINNNQQPVANAMQQQIPPMSQQNLATQQQTARKPMYPSPRPPMQQQPYAEAYQQPSQQQPTFNGQPNSSQLQYQTTYSPMSVAQQGFSKLWGQDTIDLMQHRHILPSERVQAPTISLNNQFYESINCSSEVMRCTVNKIPDSNSLLQKSRLPLGILIHPFRDMANLVVINCPTIVRCRLCRTYINPFVHFVDSKMWKCNLCYRINELPEDFQYDPVSKTFGEVTRRPEVRSSTIEFIAPSEYMLRPPQPAIYLFLFDVSILAQQSGYLDVVCNCLSKRLDFIPGDARTKVGFIAYNSEVHFYNIAEGYNQPHEITLVDIDDIFLPCPDNLLVNIKACKDLIKDLLRQLPTRFANSHDSGSALGAALQVAFKLMSSPGGRITVFQSCLPNKGPGALQSREDPNNRSAKDILHLNPATDFYKRQALECSGQQIAVDLFLLNQQYSDLATLSGVSKYSGGCIYHFPLYQKTKPQLVDSLKRSFERYLTRKIGFEAVMRVRCTRGLQIHTFHGNFFVRSTDLLSLPNVNPDAGYGMQISYEESLTDIKTICFQAALLYTTSSGERRIRVHTMCLPVTTSLNEVMYSADVQCIVGLLAKMAVDRSLTSNVSDARDAFINATVDILNAFKISQNLPSGSTGQVIVPKNLSLLPLYILALLKHIAFRTGTSTRLDDRVYAMDAMKTLPLDQLMKFIYPEFYHLDVLFYNIANENDDGEQQDPPILQLSAEFIDSRSMFLLDCGTLIIIYVGINFPSDVLQNVLGVQSTAEISDYCYGLPSLNTPENESLQAFIESLNENKPFDPIIQIIRDTSTCKSLFFEKLVDDRNESSLSYYEFLQHLRTQVK